MYDLYYDVVVNEPILRLKLSLVEDNKLADEFGPATTSRSDQMVRSGWQPLAIFFLLLRNHKPPLSVSS
jgi:hypothetical protein